MLGYLVLAAILMFFGGLLVASGYGNWKNWDEIQRSSLFLLPFMLSAWEKSRGGQIDSVNKAMSSLVWVVLGVALFVTGLVTLVEVVRQLISVGWW
jgi:uncharacterized membrane protein YidH (DUF202 family)